MYGRSLVHLASKLVVISTTSLGALPAKNSLMVEFGADFGRCWRLAVWQVSSLTWRSPSPQRRAGWW